VIKNGMEIYQSEPLQEQNNQPTMEIATAVAANGSPEQTIPDVSQLGMYESWVILERAQTGFLPEQFCVE
jgi:hypothetical protein